MRHNPTLLPGKVSLRREKSRDVDTKDIALQDGPMPETSDRWAEWVLDRGHGGQPDEERDDLTYLRPIRDRVLVNAAVQPGDVVLDVGAGDGLIAFEAARMVGEGHVIFSDVSPTLVRHGERLAKAKGLADRMRFLLATAEDLRPMEDASVQVITTRSVLIYVADKERAFREFHRVLAPGGRLSIFEPINRYFDLTPDDFWGFDAGPVRDLVEKIWAYEGWIGADPDPQDPMMNFGEGDLYRFTVEAGFSEVRVDLVLERKPGSWVKDWETLLATAPNPNARTVGEAMEGALAPSERLRLEEHIRPLVESGRGVMESAFAYLAAVKA
jgi:arsenite methyltransferase